ncbi:MAG: DUF924 family protein [Halioglobus sp.]|nr:DUF924 family protein [Halioglobus sp.]
MEDTIEDIHHFWFGELDENGMCCAAQHSLWFTRSDATDATVRERFGALLKRGAAGELDDWALTDRGLVALVVLLDQFSRNIHRDRPAAFAADPRALELALKVIEDGRHLRLPTIHRVFLYLPLEHAEDLQMQEQCVDLFRALSENGNEALQDFTRYAVAHRDVIARFRRFPHRNAILGRSSSAEELDYLRTHGGF